MRVKMRLLWAGWRNRPAQTIPSAPGSQSARPGGGRWICRHVGPVDDGDEVRGVVEVQVVGDEAAGLLFGDSLDDGVAAGMMRISPLSKMWGAW